MANHEVRKYIENSDPFHTEKIISGLRILIPKALHYIQELKERKLETRKARNEVLDYSICQKCSRNRVEPDGGWTEVDEELYLVGVRCPDCEDHSSYFLTKLEIDLFQDRLDEALRQIVNDRDTFQAENKKHAPFDQE